MGMADLFSAEDRVQVTFSAFYQLMRESARAEMLLNGTNCNVPHRFMREMVTGTAEPDDEDAPADGRLVCIDGPITPEVARELVQSPGISYISIRTERENSENQQSFNRVFNSGGANNTSAGEPPEPPNE